MFEYTVPATGPANFTAELTAAKAAAFSANVPSVIRVLRDGYLDPGFNFANTNFPITWDFGTRGNVALPALSAGQEPAAVGFVVNGQPVTMRGVRFNANSAAKCALLLSNTDIEGMDQITVQNGTELGLAIYGVQGGDVGRFYVQYTQFGGTRHGILIDSCNHARIRSLRVHGYSGVGVHVVGNYSPEPTTYVPVGYGRSSGGCHIFAMDCESHRHTEAERVHPMLLLDGCSSAVIDSCRGEGENRAVIIKNYANNNVIRAARFLGPPEHPWLDIQNGSGNRVYDAIAPGFGTPSAKARIVAALCKRNHVEGTIETGAGPVRMVTRFEHSDGSGWECEGLPDGAKHAASAPPAWLSEWESPVYNQLRTDQLSPREWRRTGSTSWTAFT